MIVIATLILQMSRREIDFFPTKQAKVINEEETMEGIRASQ